MKYLKYICTVAVLVCFLCISCKKTDQTPFFEGRSAVAISGDSKQGVVSDSLAFSFGTISSAIEDTLIRINVKVVGPSSDKDRAYRLVVNKQLSNAAADEYEFPVNFIMPANSIQTNVVLKIKRSERIKDFVARLVVDVEATDAFISGPRLELTGVPVSGPRFTVTWSSLLAKPDSWDGFPNAGLVYILGEYSRTKHQIIIDATGIASYDNLSVITDEWFYIYHKCGEWLNTYNTAHPGEPLRDENGKLVEFEEL